MVTPGLVSVKRCCCWLLIFLACIYCYFGFWILPQLNLSHRLICWFIHIPRHAICLVVKRGGFSEKHLKLNSWKKKWNQVSIFVMHVNLSKRKIREGRKGSDLIAEQMIKFVFDLYHTTYDSQFHRYFWKGQIFMEILCRLLFTWLHNFSCILSFWFDWL